LPQDPELNQLVDNIQELLDTTIYKLKYLKWANYALTLTRTSTNDGCRSA
jgi:hypothetical protein